ncbi:MAG: RcnB family protein [Hyphomonadaceae bacterium]
MRVLARTLLAGLIAAVSIAPALADPPHRGNGNGHSYSRGHGGDRHDYRDGRRDGRRYDNRRDRHDRYDRHDRRDYRGPTVVYRDYRAPPPPPRRYYVGGYIPRDVHYRVVYDYGRYRLPPPRYGHHYVDCGDGDILLVAAATGLVVWALSQNRY